MPSAVATMIPAPPSGPIPGCRVQSHHMPFQLKHAENSRHTKLRNKPVMQNVLIRSLNTTVESDTAETCEVAINSLALPFLSHKHHSCRPRTSSPSPGRTGNGVGRP
eukprot:1816969-Amphidinium_carterae.1